MMRRALALLFAAVLPASSQNPNLMVLLKGASALAFYDGEGKQTASVPVGQHPHEMVVSADGKYAFITDNGTMRIEEAGAGGNTVTIVDIIEHKRVGVIDLGKYHRPHGIDLDRSTGRLVVTTEN